MKNMFDLTYSFYYITLQERSRRVNALKNLQVENFMSPKVSTLGGHQGMYNKECSLNNYIYRRSLLNVELLDALIMTN